MDRIICMVIGLVFLLGTVVFAASKKEWISIKKTSAISCGAAQPASGNNSRPTQDQSGSGCMHQTVSAAFLNRHKRGSLHRC